MSEKISSSVYENTNGFPMANGKNLHMEVGPGDLANRIITVGSIQRAELIGSFLRNTVTITSNRGFTTITGYYNDVFVSVVSIGMGPSMMDFFVRESRGVVDGPMAIIRYGTCGGLSIDAHEGSIVVATEGSGYISRNPDAFIDNSNQSSYYNKYKLAKPNINISKLVVHHLKDRLVDIDIIEGVNITADSFYSSQGRIDKNFNDNNYDIIDEIIKEYENAKSMEMETFVLIHLANCSNIPIYATAAAIVVANRITSNVVDSELLKNLELEGGLAILKAITSFQF